MRNPHQWALALALVAAALCGMGADGCKSGSSLSATIDTPASPAKGSVKVVFTLSDSAGKPASVALELSTDGGLSYVAATATGVKTGLASGTSHSLVWDSLADLGAVKISAILRLVPSNEDGEGAAATSGSFLVDNAAGSNLPPSVAIDDPTGETHAGALLPSATYYGHLLVGFTLSDAEGDPASVKVEWSADGGVTYHPATPADALPLEGLAAPPGGKSHHFLWDSKADLGAIETEAVLRLTASDTKPGTPGRSGYLPIKNVKLVAPRGPYLQLVGPTGITVVWTTEQRTTTALAYGPTAELGTLAAMHESTTLHVVELTGLVPGAHYHYAASSSGAAVGGAKFRTTPGSGTPFGFVSFGDSGVGLSGLKIFVQEELAKAMLALEPDLLVHTGDVVYPAGEQKDYTLKFFTPYKALLARTAAYPSLGNHDVKTAAGKAYLDNFHLPRNNPKKDERYYSFDYGDVHFVALDSTGSVEPDSPQGLWLSADLAATGKKWKVVYFHHAVYSSGRHGSDLAARAALAPTFVAGGVDLVLTGHDHHYERTKPIDGIVYVVTGGGGAPLYPYDGPSPFTHTGLSEWHFVHVAVSSSSLAVKAISLTGKTIDSFTLTK